MALQEKSYLRTSLRGVQDDEQRLRAIYRFVGRSVTGPEVQLTDSGTELSDNTGFVTFASETKGAAAVRTFTVTNQWVAPLTLSTLYVPTGFHRKYER